jgi:hypothetical protein
MISLVKGAYKKMNLPHTPCVIVRLHLGQFFMEPDDYYEAPLSKVLQFTRSTGLIKG